jgi:acyl transferase domain-containing protein
VPALTAGILAFLRGAHQAAAAAPQPQLHLRTLNPLLQPSLDACRAWSAQPGEALQQLAVLPRAAAPWVSSAAAEEARLWGVSAFAFQGTNAHAVAQAPPAWPDVAATKDGRGLWGASQQAFAPRGERHWVHPPLHPLVRAVHLRSSSSPASRVIIFECRCAGSRRTLHVSYTHVNVYTHVYVYVIGKQAHPARLLASGMQPQPQPQRALQARSCPAPCC